MEVQTPLADTSHVKMFLGHPVGLGFLAFAEAWERFSFSGMQALLVLYLGQRLLLPGHVEHVAGMALNSLDFSLTASWSSTNPPVVAKAETR
jgi:dipeptide/tripeptide permease